MSKSSTYKNSLTDLTISLWLGLANAGDTTDQSSILGQEDSL